jgi:hypothetical protein
VARIYQTNNMGEADVRVAIVQRDNASEAGWTRPHRLKSCLSQGGA